ncbi:MAG: hypothetical protein QXI60_03305 [Thermofilaceae archaeon]
MAQEAWEELEEVLRDGRKAQGTAERDWWDVGYWLTMLYTRWLSLRSWIVTLEDVNQLSRRRGQDPRQLRFWYQLWPHLRHELDEMERYMKRIEETVEKHRPGFFLEVLTRKGGE